MLEANKFKLGLFVIFAIVVFLVTITSLGVFEKFKPTANLMSLFTESVQGLTSGSAVKFKGVPVGKVTNITVNAQRRLIRVDMSIDLSKFKQEDSSGCVSSKSPALTKYQFYDYLNSEIKEGLRCQIEPDGITGMKYIEIDVQKNPDIKFLREVGYDSSEDVFYLPSAPSFLGDLRTSIMSLISKLESVNYKGISDSAITALASADKLFANQKLKQSIDNIEQISHHLTMTLETMNKSFTPERIDQLMKDAHGVVKTMDELGKAVEETLHDAEVGRLSESIRETLSGLNRSNQSFGETMMRFNEALDAMTELIQYLDSDPSALISGKKKETISGK